MPQFAPGEGEDKEVTRAVLADGTLVVERGTQERPDAVVTGPPAVLAQVVYDGYGLGEATAAGDVHVEGSRASTARLLGVYSLLEPIDRTVRQET